MSLGHLPERSRKGLVTLLFGGTLSAAVWDGSVAVSIAIAAAVLSYLAYLFGRSVESKKARKRKWHAEKSHE